MEGFLEKTAVEILSGAYGETSSLAIVLPTRRAGLYLKKHLGKKAGKLILSPDIFSIEDLLSELYPGRIISGTEAVFLLYNSYLRITKEDPEPFDAFSRWAPTFLNDIQDIDRYLAEADQLFGNLEGIKELEDWSMRSGELTEMQLRYRDFWNSLYKLFVQFRSDLTSASLAYEAMALRELCELGTSLPWSHVLVCGFNAMSKAEASLFRKWHKAGKASMLWDADIYYYSDPFHEAGRFLREHIPAFRDAKKNPSWICDDLSQGEKRIHIYGVPGNTLQTKLAGEILAGSPEGSDRTALVLADETLLFPMLNAIPESVDAINVSMGHPLRSSSVFSLVDLLLRLHEQAERSGRRDKDGHLLFYHKELVSLMKHPALSLLLQGNTGQDALVKDILEKNRIFVSRSKILSHFTGQAFATMEDLMSMNEKAAILKTLEKVLSRGLELLDASCGGAEQEYFFEALNIISLVNDYDKKYDHFRELRTLVAFLRQAFRTAAIPFYGEPLRGLQVMGVLETRALDFDRIILLSANEDVLPSGKSSSSFIPFDLRKHFGLPTYSDRDAIFAYHFYRLIQRCKEIHLLYTTVKDAFGSGEKSRFLMQLEKELPRRNPKVKIESSILAVHPKTGSSTVISIRKDEEVMLGIQEILKKGISPSAINTYLECPLRFYLSRIARLSAEEEVEESVDARSMGNFIHACLEELYRPLTGLDLFPENIASLIKKGPGTLERVFLKQFSREDLAGGANLLAFEAAKGYLLTFLEWDKTEAERHLGSNEPYKLLGIEQKLNYQLAPDIVLAGIADRIDLSGGQVRVIDYKTGKVESSEIKSNTITDVFEKKGKGKSVQLLSYGLMMRDGKDSPLISGIYSFRSSHGGLKAVQINGDALLSPALLDEFREELLTKLEELTDVNVPLTQTTEEERCRYCDFKDFCNK